MGEPTRFVPRIVAQARVLKRVAGADAVRPVHLVERRSLGPPGTYTIYELAARANLSPRTISAYCSRGIIPRPIGAGRNAHYTEEHLAAIIDHRAAMARLVVVPDRRDEEDLPLAA